MGYEILSNDLFEEEANNSKKKRPQIREDVPKRSIPRRDEEDEQSKIPFIIHIVLVIIVLVIIGYFIITFFDNSDKAKNNELNILGGIESFEYNYSGDLVLKANKFEIDSSAGKFNDVNQEILIKDFNGFLSLKNKTIIVEGVSTGIEYGGNKINLKGEPFKLKSENKVEFKMFFSELNLNMSDAGIRFSKSLDYDFDSAYIEVLNFNSTIVYDGTFSISGYPTEFNLLSLDDGIFISYIK